MKIEPNQKQHQVIARGFPSDDDRILKIQLVLIATAVAGMLGSMMTLGVFAPAAPLVGMVPFFCALVFFVRKEQKARQVSAEQQAKENGK